MNYFLGYMELSGLSVDLLRVIATIVGYMAMLWYTTRDLCL